MAAAQPVFGWGVDACCVLVDALLASEGAAARAEIETTLAQAFAWLGESSAEVFRPRILEARAAVAAVLGEEAARERDLTEAVRLYRALGAEGHLRRLT